MAGKLWKDEDLRVDTFSHESASQVTITHLPTQIVVRCDGDGRKNVTRAKAFKLLEVALKGRKKNEP